LLAQIPPLEYPGQALAVALYYVIEVCEYVAERAGELRGLRIVEEPPALRHFTARFSPLTS
jgi:tryptophanase